MLIVQLDGEVRYSYRYPFSAIDPQEYRWASDELILAGAWLLISEVSFHTFFGSLENFDSPKILSTSESLPPFFCEGEGEGRTMVVGKRTTTTKRGANQRGLWIQLTHEFSEVKGQLAHHQEQTKKTTGLSGALKGPKKRGRAKKKIRTKNPQTFWLKTAIFDIFSNFHSSSQENGINFSLNSVYLISFWDEIFFLPQIDSPPKKKHSST